MLHQLSYTYENVFKVWDIVDIMYVFLLVLFVCNKQYDFT